MDYKLTKTISTLSLPPCNISMADLVRLTYVRDYPQLPALRDYGVIFLTAPPYLLVIHCYRAVTGYGQYVRGRYVITQQVTWHYRIRLATGHGAEPEQIHRRPDGTHFPCAKVVNGYLEGVDYFDHVSDGETVVGCEADDAMAMSWPAAYTELHRRFAADSAEYEYAERYDRLMGTPYADQDWSYDTIVRVPRDRLLRILDWISELSTTAWWSYMYAETDAEAEPWYRLMCLPVNFSPR